MFKSSLLLFFNIVQVVSHQPLTAEARIQSQACPCEGIVQQSVTTTCFSLNTLVIPCQYLPAVLHIHTSHFYL
jgi:hypothetical protein